MCNESLEGFLSETTRAAMTHCPIHPFYTFSHCLFGNWQFHIKTIQMLFLLTLRIVCGATSKVVRQGQEEGKIVLRCIVEWLREGKCCRIDIDLESNCIET